MSTVYEDIEKAQAAADSFKKELSKGLRPVFLKIIDRLYSGYLTITWLWEETKDHYKNKRYGQQINRSANHRLPSGEGRNGKDGQ